jgi:aryl-alcohol dehydrogenase-like predicted oxidoreductase
METRPLGRSGLEVTVLCLGSFLTFESMDRDDAAAVLRGAALSPAAAVTCARAALRRST